MIDPRLADKSPEELDSILRTITEDGAVEIPDAPQPTPEPAPAEAVEAEAPPAEASAQPEPEAVEAEAEPESEIDWKARAETLRAELEKQKLHGARLAGEIGYLRQRGNAPAPVTEGDPAATVEDYSDTARNEIDALNAQVQELREREAMREQETAHRVNLELLEHHKRVCAGLDPDIRQTVTDGHREDLEALDRELDPARKRELGVGLITRMANEGAIFQDNRNRERAQAMRQASTVANLKAKKAATVSGSGSVSAPPPRPKSYKDMTAAEADSWLRENVP